MERTHYFALENVGAAEVCAVVKNDPECAVAFPFDQLRMIAQVHCIASLSIFILLTKSVMVYHLSTCSCP